MSNYYDENGSPMTRNEWAAAFEHREPIGRDEVGDVTVSTVWLGLDHSGGVGPPLIFETMVFGGVLDQRGWRYATKAEAIAGHAAALALVRGEP